VSEAFAVVRYGSKGKQVSLVYWVSSFARKPAGYYADGDGLTESSREGVKAHTTIERSCATLALRVHDMRGEGHMLARSLSLSFAAAAALLLGACNQTQPAAAPPASNFRVLFAMGSSTLQDPELGKIQQAAAAYRSRSGASVALTGHTDTTGNPVMNQTLSRQRTDAVTAALVAAGVPAAAISATNYGEATPPVATADNVSDQKNRSVEIFVNGAPR
jgi:outer membrane protein OmpA-like peptidoglycan-associated protein